MKKNKHLYRAWFWSYVALIFGGVLSALLAAKIGGWLSILLVVLACIDLGLIIAGRVLYSKKRDLFPWFAFSAQGINTLLIVFAFIEEIALTAQGQPAVYAWVIGSISLVGIVIIDWITTHYCLKIIRHEKIIEGKQ